MSNLPYSNRLGIHYFPDTLHYQDRELRRWQPELSELGLSWLVLIAPIERAIPEYFLTGLIKSNITPILHFLLPANRKIDIDNLDILLKTYADWGVQYICLFDRPNAKESWAKHLWLSDDLVESFLDIYIPLAKRILQYNLLPIFPPLQPGGDYWDTTFLRLAIRSIQRRRCGELLDKLVIGAYAWFNDHQLNWGAGGPERWPETRPYFTPPGSQDHLGFRIFDWYSAITNAELGHTLPIILMRAGEFVDGPIPQCNFSTASPGKGSKFPLKIAQLFDESDTLELPQQNKEEVLNSVTNHESNNIPEELISCNFWLLSTNDDSPYVNQIWYKPDGTRMPIANDFYYRQQKADVKDGFTYQSSGENRRQNTSIPLYKKTNTRRIRHYLLVPLYAWGIASWDMETIGPFVQRYHPTIGFSLDEALLARRVTLVGNLDGLPKDALARLRSAKCKIDHLKTDGTILAIK